jgi:hypothetical protein
MQQTIETSALSVSCHIDGPDWGLPMVLLPDDWRTWNKLPPSLHEAGYRTIVPSLRGFGETRFKNEFSFRGNDGDRRGHDRACRRARSRPLCFGRSRLGCTRSLHRREPTRAASHPLHRALGRLCRARCKPGDGLNQIEHYWYQWYMALPQGERLVREKRTELACTPGAPGRHRGSSPKWNSG